MKCTINSGYSPRQTQLLSCLCPPSLTSCVYVKASQSTGLTCDRSMGTVLPCLSSEYLEVLGWKDCIKRYYSYQTQIFYSKELTSSFADEVKWAQSAFSRHSQTGNHTKEQILWQYLTDRNLKDQIWKGLLILGAAECQWDLLLTNMITAIKWEYIKHPVVSQALKSHHLL